MKIDINKFPSYEKEWKKAMAYTDFSMCRALCREIAHCYISSGYKLPNPILISYHYSDFVIQSVLYKITKKSSLEINISRSSKDGTLVAY